MTDEDIVAALAEAGRAMGLDPGERWYTDALLPTVREVARQLAAEELLAAARRIQQTLVPATHVPTVWAAADEITARAAALTATPNHGRNAT